MLFLKNFNGKVIYSRVLLDDIVMLGTKRSLYFHNTPFDFSIV